MTTNVAITPTNTAAGVAQLLNPVVVDLTSLSLNGKQAHWHLRGEEFISIHELLDELVDHARDWADLVAERVVALGAPTDGRTETVANTTSTPAFPNGFLSVETAVSEIVRQIDAVIERARATVQPLDEIDPVSQDVIIEVLRGLDKDRWFFASHVVEA